MRWFGWVPDPESVAQFVATLPWGSLGEALEGGVRTEDGDALLYRAMAQLTGEQRIDSRNQGKVGSCVGNGTATAGDITTACEIVIKKERERWVAKMAADALYAMSREVVGRLGSWDGSNGSWAAKAITNWGTVHMLDYGSVSLSQYSVARCKQWASRGVPEEIKAKARERKMGTTALVRTVDEARQALQNGYGINVCSNQGFSNKRDKDGFAAPRGSWPHSMAIVAWRGGSRPGFLIQNSWGNDWISGPIWPEDQPHGSFWAEPDVVGRMLRANDTFAYSNYDGFPRQSPWDWMRDGSVAPPDNWLWMR